MPVNSFLVRSLFFDAFFGLYFLPFNLPRLMEPGAFCLNYGFSKSLARYKAG